MIASESGRSREVEFYYLDSFEPLELFSPCANLIYKQYFIEGTQGGNQVSKIYFVYIS